MRVVVALGGNALLRRDEAPGAGVQYRHVEAAAKSLAHIAQDHTLIVTHGNGPQVGLLAVESAADPALDRPYPFDTLGAETQGMIGYWLSQALRNATGGREVVALITQTVVEAKDPAFTHPTKFVGEILEESEAIHHRDHDGWTLGLDGGRWRRVVPSPEPREIVELGTLHRLVDDGVIVVALGGGGVPVVRRDDRTLVGVEAVVDKDLAASLLARVLGADVLVLATDVSNVELGYGTPDAKPLGRVRADYLRSLKFPAGSMGPKVEAACRFVEGTKGRAVIGSLEDIEGLVEGTAGTVVTSE